MENASLQDDTVVKLSKDSFDVLASKAKPFESRRACLERVIKENCSPRRQIESEDSDTNLEDGVV